MMEKMGKKHDEKFKIIKDRSNLLKNIQDLNLRKENEKMGDKIINKYFCFIFLKIFFYNFFQNFFLFISKI